MSFRSDNTDEALENTAPPHFWQRWYWPTVSLAALLAFELTASPALSTVLLCGHFGLDDWRTGLWLWRTDPHRGRGRACGWFSFARAVTRTLFAAFLLLILLVMITTRLEKNRPQVPGNLPAGFWGIAILMIAGLPLATLLCLIACLSARRHSVKVWLDPGLHAARRASQWPATFQGVQNLADMPYLLMMAVVVTTVLTAMIIATVGLVPPPGVRPAVNIALMGTILGTSLALLWLLLGWTGQTRARLPHECWGPDCRMTEAQPVFLETQIRSSENPDEDGDRLDWDN